MRLMRALQAQHAEAGSLLAAAEQPAGAPAPRGAPERHDAAARCRCRSRAGPFVRNERKVGRNEPCPCGSGKKYKHCHGALSSVE